jgi:hypothetical protein
MSNEVSERLQTFVKNEWRGYKFPLTDSTRLYEDLGIYGDDAVEFLIDFGKEFNVDVSNFMAADYFKGEPGVDFVTPIINLFKKDKIKPVKATKTLTLGHLEKAIKAGRLDEEVINS